MTFEFITWSAYLPSVLRLAAGTLLLAYGTALLVAPDQERPPNAGWLFPVGSRGLLNLLRAVTLVGACALLSPCFALPPLAAAYVLYRAGRRLDRNAWGGFWAALGLMTSLPVVARADTLEDLVAKQTVLTVSLAAWSAAVVIWISGILRARPEAEATSGRTRLLFRGGQALSILILIAWLAMVGWTVGGSLFSNH